MWSLNCDRGSELEVVNCGSASAAARHASNMAGRRSRRCAATAFNSSSMIFVRVISENSGGAGRATEWSRAL